MTVKIRTLDDLGSTYEITKNTEIVKETNQTLSHFILKVDDKDLSFIINIDGKAKYKMSILEMYEDGLTREMDWFPWLQTYDDTNDIYVLIFEPKEPIKFQNLSIVLVPANTTSYSYTAGFVEDTSTVEKDTAEIKEIVKKQLAYLEVGLRRK